jgi:integrase/recombinase XerD
MLDNLDLVLRWFLDDVRGRFPASPVLFCDESGGRMAAGTIRNRLRHLMNLEGRPSSEWFSPHGLRRACATHNYERGVDLVAIQQLLGHWTVSSTMRYVRQGSGIAPDERKTAGHQVNMALERHLRPVCGGCLTRTDRHLIASDAGYAHSGG